MDVRFLVGYREWVKRVVGSRERGWTEKMEYQYNQEPPMNAKSRAQAEKLYEESRLGSNIYPL